MPNKVTKKINNYNNPYLALTLNLKLENNNDSILNLYNYISSVKNISNNDINEIFYNIEDNNGYYYSRKENEGVIKFSSNNILSILGKLWYQEEYNWESNTPIELFKLLENLGLDFTKEQLIWEIPNEKINDFLNINNKEDFFKKIEKHKIIPTTNDEIFNNVDLEENRNIVLMGHAFKQMGQEDFNKRIKKYETLHNAVKLNKQLLISFLIEKCNVDPNVLDINLNTPVMFVNSITTLKILEKYKIDWSLKNILDKDCLSNITSNVDKYQSKEMIDLVHENIKKSIYKTSNNIDIDYINKRIKQNLLEMVEANKTKKELEDYIKKYKINNFTDILDKNGNSLAQICLKNNNWARYDIFKKLYPLNHLNNHGYGSLEILFLKDRISKIDKASEIFKELLINNIQYENNFFYFDIIKEDFKKNRLFTIPNWFIQKNNVYWFATNFLHEDQATHYAINFKEINQYINNYNIDYSEENIRYNKLNTYLILNNLININKTIDLSLLPIDLVFNEEEDIINSKKINYTCNNANLLNIICLIDFAEKYNYEEILSINKLWEKFEQKASKHIIKGFYYAKTNKNKFPGEDDLMSDFADKNIHLIEFLLKKESKLFFEIIDEDFVNNIKVNKDLKSKLEYILLNKKLNNNESKIKINIKKL